LKPIVILLLVQLFFAPSSVSAREACDLRLTPNQLDYGSVTRGALLKMPAADDADLSFGSRRIHMLIQCPEPQAMVWRFIAPRADPQRFRWGAGTMQLRIVAVQLDGLAVHWRRESGEPLEADLLRPGDRVIPWRAGMAGEGLRLDVELEVDARLSDPTSRVNDLTRFEGGGRFQLN
jgi:hypothetical protein